MFVPEKYFIRFGFSDNIVPLFCLLNSYVVWRNISGGILIDILMNGKIA